MLFNKYFDLINEITEIDSENFNNAEISLEEDIDFDFCLTYTLDDTKLNDEAYLDPYTELMDSYDIKNYKIEDNKLYFLI